MKRFALFTVITMSLFLCLSGLAIAEEKKVDATLTMSEGQVAFGIGYSWGKGVLPSRGRNIHSRSPEYRLLTSGSPMPSRRARFTT